MSIQFTTPFETENQPPAYEFLAHPPPQKKRPTQPLPQRPPPTPIQGSKETSRRRSSATSVIAAWVAQVHPGSPAPVSPCSARRSSFIGTSRRPSITRLSRRSSATSSRVPSASFLSMLDTPSAVTPSIKDYRLDLTCLGYAYAVVALPTTPQSAAPRLSADTEVSQSHTQKKVPGQLIIPTVPISPAKTSPKKNALNRLRSRLRSKSVPPSPARSPSGAKMPTKAAKAQSGGRAKPKPKHARRRSRSRSSVSPSTHAFAIARRKKALYQYQLAAAVPLQNELALMQFADGGSQEDNIRRLMAQQAKAHGEMGVADVYRDGRGGVWWDEYEEWEYAHLLGGEDAWAACARADAHEWVEFSSAQEEEERRGSLSSQDSDLDPRYAVPVERGSADDLAAFGSALVPAAARTPGLSVLAIPARSRRTAPHLRKAGYVLDAFAFAAPRSPVLRSPTRAYAVPKGKARRRPAPLTLLPPQTPAAACATNSPASAAVDPRAAFLADSFAPPVPPKDRAPEQRRDSVARRTVAKKQSRLNLAVGGGMKGLFRAMGGKK